MLQDLTATPVDRVERAVFTQTWADLAMLHWPVDPDRVAPLLPAGTAPDVHDGATWVGLIPFSMRGVGILGTPPAPYVSSFAETNVRLYAVDRHGRRGVVFRSLEASRLLPVLAARVAYRLPYCWARMRVERDGDVWTWTTRRRLPGPDGALASTRPTLAADGPQSRIRLEVGGSLDGSSGLPLFLTARWGLFSRWYGRTAYAPVDHDAWQLRSARVLELSDDLVAAAGLPVQGPAPSVLFSPGVQVRIGRPRPLR